MTNLQYAIVDPNYDWFLIPIRSQDFSLAGHHHEHPIDLQGSPHQQSLDQIHHAW